MTKKVSSYLFIFIYLFFLRSQKPVVQIQIPPLWYIEVLVFPKGQDLAAQDFKMDCQFVHKWYMVLSADLSAGLDVGGGTC